MQSNENTWIIGGVTTSIVVPVLSIFLDIPLYISICIGILAGLGTGLMLTPRRPFDRIDTSDISSSYLQFASEILSSSKPIIGNLQKSAPKIKNPAMRQTAFRIIDTTSKILSELETRPERIQSMRRVLTYYLPKTPEIFDHILSIEKLSRPDENRLRSLTNMLSRLDDAFTHYADDVSSDVMTDLDIEMKLINQSLDEDIGIKKSKESVQ